VRTDFAAPKHEGISFVLFDMASPGVSTSPISLISGSSPFCQTFFDNVKVPKHNLVGTPNHGWTIAKRLLQHERQMVAGIGGNSALGATGRRMEDIAKEYAGDAGGRIADTAIRSKVTSHRMNDRAFQLTLGRSVEEAKAGRVSGDLSSMFKYYGTEQNKRKYEVLLETMGTQAVGWDGAAFSDRELNTTRQWLRSKANSIEGGTSEVQLNVIAKRVLGLPD
jgi:alkylation response protein AidB-like acyl-CoA dehydrogenase